MIASLLNLFEYDAIPILKFFFEFIKSVISSFEPFFLSIIDLIEFEK